MRFSEAVLLGSTDVTPVGGVLYRNNFGSASGCALGMAMHAIGVRTTTYLFSGHPIRLAWPWILCLVESPCACSFYQVRSPMIDIVSHLFDVHVMGLVGMADDRALKLTFDDLLEWIRTQENLLACPNCHIGVDDDGDGNCAKCAGQPTAAAVQEGTELDAKRLDDILADSLKRAH